MILSASTVSDQSGVWVFPRNPSWAMTFTTDEDDREPACPTLPGDQAEACEDEQHSPEHQHPAPPRQVEDEEAGPGRHVVLILEQGDQTLKEVDPADEH